MEGKSNREKLKKSYKISLNSPLQQLAQKGSLEINLSEDYINTDIKEVYLS